MRHARWVRRVGALAAVLLLAWTAYTLGAVAPISTEGHQWPCPEGGQASVSTTPQIEVPGASARLHAIADAIAAVRGDMRDPRSHPFMAVHTQHWSVAGDEVKASDRIIWRADDGTARLQTRRLTVRRDPSRPPDATERIRLATAPAESVDYPQADGTRLGGVIDGPVPHDPQTLANALYAQRGIRCRPDLLLDLYVLLANDHYLDQGARAAGLRMLAAIPGLTYDGTAADLFNRRGAAFALDRSWQQTRDTILLDPTTGALLTATTATSTGRLIDHTLFLAANRTPNRFTPPSL